MNGSLGAAELLQRAHALSKELEDAGIWNEIRFFRQDGITVLARVPGEYWEIDLLEDGITNVEVLRSTGDLEDESSIHRLISEFGEKPKH
jgi:hypothetical protein